MRMNKAVFLIIAVMLLSMIPVSAQRDELFDYHALDVNMSISNDFVVRKTNSDFYIDRVMATLSWIPQEDYRQKVSEITTEPGSDFREGEGFVFTWERPSTNAFSLREDSRLSAKNEFLEVDKKIAFPIKDLDPAYSEYLQPQEIIDINSDIKSLASSLVKGEDDLFKATFKIAAWVENNIKYNLTSMTADASQKSSWVLLNKKGVCDELTSLFISLCRSVGIPARFVTGVSYSNINLQNDGWGPHGWAEVYFPEYGWVPFDVTYRELGYIDATHIKLKTTPDARETSIDYTTRGSGAEIIPGSLKVDVNIVGKDYKINPLVEINARAKETIVGFGSYNLITVSVKNLQNYYVAEQLFISRVNELEVIGGSNEQSIILAPFQEKNLYWLVRVNPSLDSFYTYTFPIKVIGSFGEEASASFKSSGDGKSFSQKYMTSFIEDETSPAKPYSDKLTSVCTSDKKEVYLAEDVKINCFVKNDGNAPIARLNVCLDSDCTVTSIDAKSFLNYSYEARFSTLGVKVLVFSADSSVAEKEYYVIVEVQDEPLIELYNLTFPESMPFDQDSEIMFLIRKKSSNQPLNLKVALQHDLINHEWTLSKLESNYEFRILINSKDFVLGRNDFKIRIGYEDKKGNPFYIDKDFSIMLEDPNIIQKISIWFNMLDHKLSELFSGMATKELGNI